MFPIERITLRAKAYSILGVSRSASRDDIRRAYRDLAFQKHPDRHPEFGDDFARITEAYRYICEEQAQSPDLVEPANAPAEPRRTVSRPGLKPEDVVFDAASIGACWALLKAVGGPGTLHVATRLYRRGRSLAYYVETPMQPGRNEVAVPTGMLEDARYVLPKIVAFDAREAAGGTYDVPSDQCAEHFPGARAISIRFGSV